MPRRPLFVCLLCLLLGVCLLALPASIEGRVLVPISEGHGLSTLDLIGAVLIAIGGTWLEVLVVLRLPHLRVPPRALFGLGVLAGLGIGLLVASVASGFFYWWAVGAAVFGIALLTLVGLSIRRT